MPIRIIRQDITALSVDAIVNPTNADLCPGGGTDAAIHAAAGPRLYETCAALGGCAVGQAKITPAFQLPCRYVIHTVGPVWAGGGAGEPSLLQSCYRESLRLAQAHACQSIAFPLIASGTGGYPKDRVLRVALDCIGDFLQEHEMTVYVVVYDKSAVRLSEELYGRITAYIDDRYVEERADRTSQRMRRQSRDTGRAPKTKRLPLESPVLMCTEASMAPAANESLEDALRAMDKGFAQTLFDYIDQKGLTDVECYKRANVDRKTFSKIKCSKNYKPSKATVLSFAVALRLTPEETDHLLNTVGMSLSRSSKFDVIVEFFIRNGNYDIHEINETLFAFDQTLLGA